jgi:hypothetical protein
VIIRKQDPNRRHVVTDRVALLDWNAIEIAYGGGAIVASPIVE